WRLGIASGSRRLTTANGAAAPNGEARQAPVQLALPPPIPAAPSLRELGSWERLVADYASTGVAIADHPMALLRPSLDEGTSSSADLRRLTHGWGGERP